MFCIAALVCLAAYAPSLKGPFVYDDTRFIVENTRVHLTGLSLEGLLNSLKTQRPVTSFTFAINHLVHGMDTFGYHLANVVLHIACGAVFFLLAKITLLLCLSEAGKKQAGVIALAAACIWMLHPAATGSVSYIVQRATVLYSLFFVASIYAYARARLAGPGAGRIKAFAASILCAVLAIGSKQSALALPFCIFLYEWVFFQGGKPKWLAERLVWLLCLAAIGVIASALLVGVSPVEPFTLALAGIALLVLGGLGALIAIPKKKNRGKAIQAFGWAFFAVLAFTAVLVWRQTNPGAVIFDYENVLGSTLTPMKRLITQWRVLFYYISLYFFPAPYRLSLVHDFAVSETLFDPPLTLFAGAGLLGLVVSGLVLARRRPMAGFAIFWFVLALALESSVINLEMVAEQRMYLPFMFAVLAICLALAGIGGGRAIKTGGVFALCLVLALASFSRNRVWADSQRLWQDALNKAPGISLPYVGLAGAYFEKNLPSIAEYYLWEALKVNPLDLDAAYSLGIYYKRIQNYAKAVDMFELLIQLRPDHALARQQLGIMHMEAGRPERAAKAFEEAIARAPGLPEAHNNLGMALMALGKPWDAIGQFQKALSIEPDFFDATINLALAFFDLNQPSDAKRHLEQVLSRIPQQAQLIVLMGNILLGEGQVEDALEHFFTLLAKDKNNPSLHNSLGIALNAQGLSAEAAGHFGRAAKLLGDRLSFLMDMGLALTAVGRADEAAPYFGRAFTVRHELGAAYKNLGVTQLNANFAEDALVSLKQALALLPNDFEVPLSLGVGAASLGNLEMAGTYFEQAVLLAPENAQARKNLGLTLARQGLYDDALAQLQEAVRLNPDDQSTKRDINWVLRRME
ncbi:MAG: tetratricopeptide repeat protein [Desulfatibacillaceae bacterium]|nr:tetratricopeptide repeat protein [Desulfatibacillaceae bacterium]